MGEISASFAPSLELKLCCFLINRTWGWTVWLNTCYQITTGSVSTECWSKFFESSGFFLHCHPTSLFWGLSVSLLPLLWRECPRLTHPCSNPDPRVLQLIPYCIKNEQFFCYRKGLLGVGGGNIHTHTYVCVCVCVYIYIYIFI